MQLLLVHFAIIYFIPDKPEDIAVEMAKQQWRSKAPRRQDAPLEHRWDDAGLLAIYGRPGDGGEIMGEML